MRTNRLVPGAVAFWALVASACLAQEEHPPTFSLEAVAIEGIRLSEPSSSVKVGPGERILVKMFLRDWSPNGQKLRSYQAELDAETFVSGDSGAVTPTRYQELRDKQLENPGAAYIDDKDPQYIHSGLHIIPIADTIRAPGYRWLTVLLNPEDGPISAQDGTKYYLGTAEFEVSEDAAGLFTVRFVEKPESTGLIDPQGQYIFGINYEGLKVAVDPSLKRLMIRESDPPDGAIDARVATRSGDAAARPWSTVSMGFNLGAEDVTKSDFEVIDGTDSAPAIQHLQVEGTNVVVMLAGTIREGRWTDIVYKPTGSRVRLGYLPGDVTNDARTDASDLAALVSVLNSTRELPSYCTDLDRNGATDASDLTTLIDLMSGLNKRGGERIASAK